MAAHASDDAPKTSPLTAVKLPRKRAPRAAPVVVDPTPAPAPAPAPDPAPPPAPAPAPDPPPAVDPDALLRSRLIAALRPKLTTTVAGMYVDILLPEVKAYGEDVAGAVVAAQAQLISDLVSTAQDCLDVFLEGDTPV